MAESQSPVRNSKNYTRKPRLYVLYTMSGEEQEMINLLYKTIVKVPDTSRAQAAEGTDLEPENGQEQGSGYAGVVIPFYDECLFSPMAIFNRKFHGQYIDIPKRLYPGYVFLNTNVPDDFYNRMVQANFFSRYGKSLRVLRDVDAAKSAAKSFSESNVVIDKPEFETYMARFSEEEERSLLSLFALERDDHGNVVRSRTNDLSEEMREKLEKAGVRLNEADKKDNDISEMMKKRARYGSPAPEANFVVLPSTGVKIGTGPGSKIVVYDGPLKGREGLIVKVNRHKRIAWIRVPFMGTERLIQMPLSVVKVLDPK